MGNKLRPTSPDQPISIPGAFFWTLVLLALEHLCVDVSEAARGGPVTDIVSLATCKVLAASIAAFAIVRVHAPDSSLRRAMGLSPFALHHFLLSAAVGIGLCPALSAFDDAIAARFPYDDPDMLASIEKLVTSAPSGVLVFGMFVAIPVVTELFFHGLLFGGLRSGVSVPETVGVTALLYALASLDLRAMPSALILGLSLGWLRAQSGSVLSAITGVVAFHAWDGVAILRGHDPLEDMTYATKWVVGGAVLALVALAATRPRSATARSTN